MQGKKPTLHAATRIHGNLKSKVAEVHQIARKFLRILQPYMA
jgi:hypothetical protein